MAELGRNIFFNSGGTNGYRKISIVNGHVPTEGKDIEAKTEFYEALAEVVEYLNTTEGKSLHKETNENGRSSIQFAIERKIKAVSTSFDHNNIHKITWISSNYQPKNQIDQVLTIEKKHFKAVRDCGSYRSADANSDHVLALSKIKQEIPSKETVKKKDSELLIEEELNLTRQKSEEQPESNEREEVEEPSEQEIRKIIKKLKSNKSAGQNGISAEILKNRGQDLLKTYTTLYVEFGEKK
ncbi:hypothetical protein ILUMI_13322 [Ignelater luminosus]|uniref:Uncharacterized protein n=1 Tax=Ignelater luminosus TaxID=2038154 RepID=A0A8K0CSL5_IGNLU|nr:hypothetical protein ILUMI_13322 [Ignelater luminosus]